MSKKSYFLVLLSIIILLSISNSMVLAGNLENTQMEKDIKLLKNAGINDEQIRKLGDRVLDIASLLNDNVMDERYLSNAVNSMINYKHKPLDENISQKIILPTQIENTNIQEYSTLSYSGTGAYWKAVSISGVNQIKSYVKIPDSSNFNVASSNDVPHLYLGLENVSTAKVIDAGIYYNESLGKFCGFTNDAQNTYLIFSLSRTILPNNTVYLQLRPNNDSYILTIWDPLDWTVIGNVEKTVPSTWGMDYSSLSLKSRYVTSIAQFVGDDFTTGSYMLNVNWYNTYLSFSGYSYLFSSNYADGIGYHPNDINVVNWSIINPYYNTYISIDYR